ncbi:MAG TPA: hypothetical protein VGB45_04985 [Abditibacterium sp.]|jgi:hypothetical protein
MARFWKTDAQSRPNPLVPDWIYFVEVCSFTFTFSSRKHIEKYLAHFSQKIHPSSADGATHGSYSHGDHWERQSCFDELPLYLFEEPKRLKVVKALTRALVEFAD